jgi:hypothetical protein
MRARRWDAIVRALPGLITGTRLALDKKRVLLVEEEASARVPPSLRDPFVIPHAKGGPIDRCLRTLGVPLIDRRRLSQEPVGMQVLLPGVRANIGTPTSTAEELVAWGLAKPEEAAEWVEAWVRASEAENALLQDAMLVRTGRNLGLGRGRSQHGVASPAVPTDSGLAQWISALSAGLTPTGDRAAPRAVGAVLEGVGSFASAAESLTGLLRQRFQALHGEIRLVSQRFSLVNLDGAPAVRPGHGAELWVGRAIVINCPVASLRHLLREAGDGDPNFLPDLRVRAHRVVVSFDTERDQIPEGMARRLVDASSGPDSPVVRIGWNPSRSGARAEVFASATIRDANAQAVIACKTGLVERVRALMPFAGERLQQRDAVEPTSWDDDSILEEARAGQAWPREIGVRLVARPRVYWLPRGAVGSLGTEGECLLGWRAGDAILEDLG